MLSDEKMYEVMRAVERKLDERGLPKVMVNTVISLNEMGCLQAITPPNNASTGQAASGFQSDDNSTAACR